MKTPTAIESRPVRITRVAAWVKASKNWGWRLLILSLILLVVMRRKPDKIKMETIAKKLGVSVTTVHYALRNPGSISDATRKRVLKMVKAMRYRPDGLARSFRRRKSETIGVILEELRSSYHSHLIEGIEQVSQSHRHAMLVSCSRRSPQVERELVEIFLEKGAEGIIIVPTAPVMNRLYYRDLLAHGVSLVFADLDIPGVAVERGFHKPRNRRFPGGPSSHSVGTNQPGLCP